MKVFITSKFSYNPCLWMSRGRTMNKRITKIYEKVLRVVYKNETKFSFGGLLKKNNSMSVPPRNSESLATGIYRVKNNLWPETMKDTIFFVEKPHNLQIDSTIQK